jgi:hypothetical protein
MKDKMYKKIVDCLKTYSVCLDMDFNEACYTVGNGTKKYSFAVAFGICLRTRSIVYYTKNSNKIGLAEFNGKTWFY